MMKNLISSSSNYYKYEYISLSRLAKS